MRSDEEEVSHHGRFITDGSNNVVFPVNVDRTKKTVGINGKAIFNKETESDRHKINSVMIFFLKISIP